MNAFAKKMVQFLENKKNDQKGFTLLELLVVVAILAAIAGTATIALKDTDARASAAAHVAMMDELNKGIRTYRVLKKNELPSRFDSLVQATTADSTIAANVVGLDIAGFSIEVPSGTFGGDAALIAIPETVQDIMFAGGIESLQYVNNVAGSNPDGNGDCSDLKGLISDRGNAVVAGNIFMSPKANGCGFTAKMHDPEGSTAAVAHMGVWWVGGGERLTGRPDDFYSGTSLVEFDGTNLTGTSADGANSSAYLLTGIGPSSTLFDVNELGGMTTVPVYRHVKADEYNRFIAVWNVGHFDGAGAIVAGAQAELVAIVDGALDTKEEELGEWDGTRNTI